MLDTGDFVPKEGGEESMKEAALKDTERDPRGPAGHLPCLHHS